MIFTQPSKRLFLPTDISNTIVWLDSNDPAGTGVPPSNNSLISTWFNKAAGGVHFTQATTSNQPQNKTNQINGHNAVYCGNNTFSYVSSASGIDIGANFSFLLVFQPVATSSRWLIETTSTPEFFVNFGTNLVQPGVWNGTANIGQITGSITTATTYLMTYTYNSTGSAQMWLNGVSKGTSSFSTYSTAGSFIRRVGANSGITQGYNGYICEVIYSNSMWSALDRRRLEVYAGTKWGIAV